MPHIKIDPIKENAFEQLAQNQLHIHNIKFGVFFAINFILKIEILLLKLMSFRLSDFDSPEIVFELRS